jgi:hypothetical protein
MRASIHELRLTNRVTITLIFNLEEDTWIIVHKEGKGTIRDSLDTGSCLKERTHHHFWINSRDYEMVIDPSEENDTWETFSFFDVKKQMYIENASGNISEETK